MMEPRSLLVVLAVVLLAAACSEPAVMSRGTDNQPTSEPLPQVQPVELSGPAGALAAVDAEAADVGKKELQPPAEPEVAPPASASAAVPPKVKASRQAISSWFAGQAHARVHLQTDKPLYHPGETVWFQSWDLDARTLSGAGRSNGVTVELISPKGAAVITKNLALSNGVAQNDLELPLGVPGGEYKLRMRATDGQLHERPIIVSSYEPPRIKKKMDFLRKAYGAGQEVSAKIEIQRAAGGPLADKVLEARVRVDGEDLAPVQVRTNAYGGGIVRFTLPKAISRGDALLTVLVEDGGVTESISRSVPIVLDKLQFDLYPEGGDLVQGLPSRVYFAARNMLGKPADVRGELVDEAGHVVASLESYHQGMGRFEVTPAKGRSYKVRITSPPGIAQTFPLPEAKADGCVLRTFDDVDGTLPETRVSVRCASPREVSVVGVLRDRVLGESWVKAGPKSPAVVYLGGPDAAARDKDVVRAQGVLRVTVLDAENAPLAERLVYRNRQNRIDFSVETEKAGYGPRDTVNLTVTARDGDVPIEADLALSVVDDTVISFADDKTGHMLSRLFLEPEVPGAVEEPNVYFDLTEKKGAVGLDMLLGTRGWRRFEWKPVFAPPVPTLVGATGAGAAHRRMGGGGGVRKPANGLKQFDFADDLVEGELMRPDAAMVQQDARPRPVVEKPAPMAPPADEPMLEAGNAEAVAEIPAQLVVVAGKEVAAERGPMLMDQLDRGDLHDIPVDGRDKDWDGKKKEAAAYWAPVRVFPVPDYSAGFTGERTDFRETIFWAPGLRTDKEGRASVSFPMSDAITSFRVFVEGVGGGAAGHHEHVFESTLPFSMAVKLPVEVSAGDRLLMPLTLSNERDAEVQVAVDAELGDLLALDSVAHHADVTLPAGARRSLFFPVDVIGDAGTVAVKFQGTGGQLGDAFARELTVVPVGFPQTFERSGQVNGNAVHEVDLNEVVPGSLHATIRFYPSPLSTMISGLEGMLRQPSGCFEQTSSTNYPNVMVMQYLRENNLQAPEIEARATGLMDDGYRRLTGYESDKGGYEWFGEYPGHEALTAYGLLEFADMKPVFGAVDTEMVSRTQHWLKQRADGKGGYQRNARALDSFGQASETVTAAYITWAVTEASSTKEFDREVEAQAHEATTTADPYVLALAANTLFNVPARRKEALAAAARLAAMQSKEGHWTGADHSVTRSGGLNLDIETTALATMALMDADLYGERVRRAVDWLQNNRSGFGQWGATQATVLTLKALTLYTRNSRKTEASGSVTVIVNGKVAGETTYEKGHKDAIEIDVTPFVTDGHNRIEVIHEGKMEMPYSLLVEHRSSLPASSAESVVGLSTQLEATSVKMGDPVRLNVNVKNVSDKGQPMALARVGLPSGLTYQTWQLKQLREKGVIGFWETRGREVVLYFRDLAPSASIDIPLDLVATVPGHYRAPASSAYLYYTDEHKTWVEGVEVDIAAY